MSEPKTTLQQVLAKVHARATTPEGDLALIEFLELPDAEQKSIFFKELVHQGVQLDWIMEQLRK